MGTLIAVYLLIAIVLALLFFGSIMYAAMYGKAPFGISGMDITADAAALNASCHELIMVTGVYMGTTILVSGFGAYAAYLGLFWPATLHHAWTEK